MHHSNPLAHQPVASPQPPAKAAARLRSPRVGTLVVRCQTDEHEAAVDFGEHAMQWRDQGLLRRAFDGVGSALGRMLASARGRKAPCRAAIADLHADDMDTERARLEAQGAKTVARTTELCVMESPCGQRFFVFSPSSFNTL